MNNNASGVNNGLMSLDYIDRLTVALELAIGGGGLNVSAAEKLVKEATAFLKTYRTEVRKQATHVGHLPYTTVRSGRTTTMCVKALELANKYGQDDPAHIHIVTLHPINVERILDMLQPTWRSTTAISVSTPPDIRIPVRRVGKVKHKTFVDNDVLDHTYRMFLEGQGLQVPEDGEHQNEVERTFKHSLDSQAGTYSPALQGGGADDPGRA